MYLDPQHWLQGYKWANLPCQGKRKACRILARYLWRIVETTGRLLVAWDLADGAQLCQKSCLGVEDTAGEGGWLVFTLRASSLHQAVQRSNAQLHLSVGGLAVKGQRVVLQGQCDLLLGDCFEDEAAAGHRPLHPQRDVPAIGAVLTAATRVGDTVVADRCGGL